MISVINIIDELVFKKTNLSLSSTSVQINLSSWQLWPVNFIHQFPHGS